MDVDVDVDAKTTGIGLVEGGESSWMEWRLKPSYIWTARGSIGRRRVKRAIIARWSPHWSRWSRYPR